MHPGRSELAAHPDPVLPIFHSLPRLRVRMDRLELGQRHSETALLPPDPHEHLVHTLDVGRHADRLDLVANVKRGNHPLGYAIRQKGEMQRAVQVTVPAHRSLFRAIRVDQDLHVDPILSRGILLPVLHVIPALARRG